MKIPNMREIVEALRLGAKEGYHAGNAFGEIDNRVKVTEYMREHEEECQALYAAALKLTERPMECLKYSFYRQFDTCGSRDDYQKQYFEHRDRVKIFSMAYYLFENSVFLEEAQNAVWSICDEYTWCLPAHLSGLSLEILPETERVQERDGRAEAYICSHRNKLDLFACETAEMLAETIRMLGEKMYPDLKHRVITEIISRVFEQYLKFNRVHGFELDLSNWSAVCGGAIGCAAIYLIEEEELLAPVIQRVISDLDVFLSSYGEDGIGKEGIGYWRYGFFHFCSFAEMLKERTAGKINLFNDEKVKSVAFFPVNAYLYQSYCANFSDCRAYYPCQTELISFLKKIYPDMPDITWGKEIYQENVSLRKIFWSSPLKELKFRCRSEFFPNAAWLISCTETEKACLSFVIKGGTNNEPHNHNDLGSFILMADDEQMLCELGVGLYTKDYFGKNRYQYLVNSSRGHSVPIIEDMFQEEGEKSAAVVQDVKTGEDYDSITLDLSSAYKVEKMKKFTRRAILDRRKQQLRICDFYKCNAGTNMKIIERFVSRYKPVIKENTVEIIGESYVLKMRNAQKAEKVCITEEEFIQSNGQKAAAWFIDYHYVTVQTELDVEMIMDIEKI